MFDHVPVRVLLLLIIVLAAYAPTLYLYRHVATSPSRRDITQSPEDLSWRTSRNFVRCAAILAFLAAASIFIFTPQAEQFARSPSFLPILMAGIAVWALYTLPLGLVTGKLQPLAKGFYDTYDRHEQPKRFWASFSWNAVFGSFCLWMAYQLNGDAADQRLADRCYDGEDVYSPQQELAACNELLGDREERAGETASLVGARGNAYFRLGDYRRAIADYNEAIRLDPHESYAYFNRGLLLLDAGHLDEAAADFGRANKLDPKDPWALANRGLAYAWKKDSVRAEADFKAVRMLDRSNPVMLRGEAIILKNSGDFRGAVNRLTASMVRDPDNLWALRTRAELYWDLGEVEESRADDARWLELNKALRARLGESS